MKYRRLEKGEIIQAGDEIDRWEPAGNIGEPAPDPQYPSHRQYRRPIITLIGARVRAERLVQERDEAREKNWADHYFRQWQESQEQVNRLRAAIQYWSHCMSEGMKVTCPEKAGELAEFLMSCEAFQ